MKASFKNISVSLIGLSLLSTGFMGCQTEQDPVSRYAKVKETAVAPHDGEKTPWKIQKVEYDPQVVVVDDFFFVEADPTFTGFVEGAEKSLRIKATSRLPQKVEFSVKVVGLQGAAQPTKVPGKKGEWEIKWNPEPSSVPSSPEESKRNFHVVIVPDPANTDPLALKAMKNEQLTYALTTTVLRDVRPPEILDISWEGKKSEDDTTIEMNEGEIKSFSVTVKSPGASKITRPEVSTAGWSSSMDSGNYRILRGTDFVRYASTTSVEELGKNTWVYHMVFDTKNLQVAYPAQILSDKPVDADAANYRVILSSFNYLSDDPENQKGATSFSKPLDFKVKYTGAGTRLFFPWDDGRDSLEACQGQVYSYNFEVTSNTGVGQIAVDTEAALSKFKRNAGVTGATDLSCTPQRFDSSRTTCLFRWNIPKTVKDGTYDLTLTAVLTMGEGESARTVTERTSTEGIKINSKNSFCNSTAPKAEVIPAPAPDANKAPTETAQEKEEPKND